MADIFRGPLLVNKREQPPVLSVVAWVGQALLLTTLAVLPALPPGEAQCASAPSLNRINPDTSRGTPKTLTADAQLPVGKTPLWDPLVFPRLFSETSKGTAKTLYPDISAPVGFEQTSPVPQLVRTVWDTTKSQSITLQVVVPPPPVVNPPTFAPYKFWYQSDTSTGTAKTLTQDAQLPVGYGQTTPAPQLVRMVVDTGHGQPITLQVIVPPAPVVNPPHIAPVKFWWQPPDTTKGTAKPLYPDAQLPVGYEQTASVGDRVRPVADTSRGTPVELFPVVVTPLPVGEQLLLGPQRFFFQPDDTSTSAYGPTHPIIVIPLPPGQAGFVAAPRHVWQVRDTSTWAYSTLYPPPYVPPAGSTGTSCITMTRDQMIASSLRLLHVLQDGQAPSAAQLTSGAEDLNTLITAWQARGLQLWTYQWLPIPMQQNKNTYTIGPSGADVTSVRPLRLMLSGSYLHSTTGFDRPLNVLSRTEYAQMSEKSFDDTVNSIYYQPGIDSGSTTSPSTGYGTLYVFSNAINSTDIVVCNFQRPIYVMTSGTDEFDFPCEWYLAIRYALAVVMADQYEIPQSRLIRLSKQAAEHHKKLLDWSVEQSGFRFIPDQRLDNPWGGWT